MASEILVFPRVRVMRVETSRSASSCRENAAMLSVVVPALNEDVHLRRTVESLLGTVPDDTEVIVVDDGSTDGCADFLRSETPIATLLEPAQRGARLGVAQARNKGARAARGE